MLLQFENLMVLWALLPLLAWIGFQAAIRIYWPESASWRRAILSSLAFLFLILALARPQLGRQMMQKRALKGNLFIALDVSKSMNAADVLPSRIEFAVAYAGKLVKKLSGIKFALFPFAETGYVMMPLTTDTHVAEEMLAVLGPGVTTARSTNLSASLEALFTAIKKMESTAIERGEDWAPSQVIVLSDGESHAALSSSLMGYYRAERIPIFTVLTGTQAGGQISIEEENPQPFRGGGGQRVLTKADPKMLDEISRATGGELFPPELSTADRAAQKIMQAMAMGRLTATFKVEREFYPVLLLLALACLTLDLLLGRWSSALRKTSLVASALLFTLFTPSAFGESRNPSEDPEHRAVDAYNQALKIMNGNDTKKAMELFQESATITKDKTQKKKALLALGNAYLKMMEPAQAVQSYQLAHDAKAPNQKFEDEANKRISENIALAVEMQAAMMQMAKEEQEKQKKQGEGQGKDKKDPQGPQRDYDNQPFSQTEKEKMFDLMGTEDQGIQGRLMQEKAKKEGKDASGKPW